MQNKSWQELGSEGCNFPPTNLQNPWKSGYNQKPSFTFHIQVSPVARVPCTDAERQE